MEWLYKLGGLAAIVAGGFMILFAFASTALDHGDRDDPPPPGILRRVTDEQRGPLLLLGGSLLGLAGLWLAFSKNDPRK